MRSTFRRLPALAAVPPVTLLLLACIPCLTTAPAVHAEIPPAPSVSVTETDSKTDSEEAHENKNSDGHAAAFALGVGLALADHAAQTDFSLGGSGSVTVTGETRTPESESGGSFNGWSAGTTGGTLFADNASTPAPNPEPGEWLVMGMMGGTVLGLMLRSRRRRALASSSAI